MSFSAYDIDVRQLIPQQHPFVMVDALFAYSDTEVIAGLTIHESNILVRDEKFTEPGLIEHMAQSVALHTGYQYHLKKEPAPTGYIGAIKNITILSLPKLNDQLRTTVQIMNEFMGISAVKISVNVDGNEIAFGEMKTVVAS
ncbi:hypothetical protein MWU59_05485 [Flavobacteriaceae bacterium F08102]|nr:hypothetical protein [Flavobacteriaceae bacterium F08102]